MKRIIPILLLLLAFSPLNVSADTSPQVIDLNHLSQTMKEQQKHLFLFFHKEGCSYCEDMIVKSIKTPQIQSKLKQHFIFIDINIDMPGMVYYRQFKGSHHAFAKSLGIGLYPTAVFVDGNNEIIHGIVGYRNARQLSLAIDYVQGEYYKKMDFEAYQNEVEFLED
ncbi:MAG: thioredoxin fold domain-containing protein [Campylobacterales bacterium]|nr:thioredoxin fold domain-containing protein [Campylobacterales bacterium]